MLRSENMHSYQDIFSSKQRILFVTAHPDDLVVFFGALIRKLRDDGKEVFALLVTNGARGSRENTISELELSQQRLKEEQACLSILGVDEAHSFCLGYADGEVESNMKLIGEISYYLRKYQIQLVATHEPSLQYLQTYDKQSYFVQHRDHRKTGEAVIDAVYPFSRDRSFFSEQFTDGVEPHEVFEILLTDEKACNFEFEFTQTQELKKQAMRAHKSQFDEATIIDIISAFTIDNRCLERFQYLKLAW